MNERITVAMRNRMDVIQKELREVPETVQGAYRKSVWMARMDELRRVAQAMEEEESPHGTPENRKGVDP